MGYIRLITHLLTVYQLPGGHSSSKAFFSFRKDLFVDDSIPELESSSCCLAVAPVLLPMNQKFERCFRNEEIDWAFLCASSQCRFPQKNTKKAIRFSNMKHLCIAAFCSVFLQSQELPCKKLNTSPTKTPGLKP